MLWIPKVLCGSFCAPHIYNFHSFIHEMLVTPATVHSNRYFCETSHLPSDKVIETPDNQSFWPAHRKLPVSILTQHQLQAVGSHIYICCFFFTFLLSNTERTNSLTICVGCLCVYVCFSYDICVWSILLIWERFYIWEEFWNVHLLMTNHPEVTMCSWQMFKSNN